MMSHTLTELLDEYVILKLKPGTPAVTIFDGMDSEFLSITQTPHEFSVICGREQGDGLASVVEDRSSGWRCLRIETTSAPSEVPGIIASVVTPLANAGISVFAVASYDTDHILVKNVAEAELELTAAGHTVRRHLL